MNAFAPEYSALPGTAELVTADHRLAGRREIRRADLSGEPMPRWANPAGTAALAFWTGTDTQPGPKAPAPPDRMDYSAGPVVSDMNQLLDAVALGPAIAFVPASVASRHTVPDLVFVPVTRPEPEHGGGSLARRIPVTRNRPVRPHRR